MHWPQLSMALPPACEIQGEPASSRQRLIRWSRVVRILGFTCVVLYFSIGVLAGKAYAQLSSEATNDDTVRGIKLYDQGDSKGAARVLSLAVKNHTDDAAAWYYLGLALTRTGDIKRARKAFEATVKLRPLSADARTGLAYTLLLTNKSAEAEREARFALEFNANNIDAHYVVAVARLRAGSPSHALSEVEAALAVKPDFAAALLLKSQILISIFTKEPFISTSQTSEDRYLWLKSAMESLEKFLKLSPNEPDINVWREQLDSLSTYAQLSDRSNPARSIFSGNEVSQRLRVLSKPEPTYTEAARLAGVQGKVVLLAVMGADGNVKHIIVLEPLSHGMTEQSIRAARNIRFQPAMKDFQPVSQVVHLEYNFHLY